MPLFSRYIAIDWSGAATATDGVDLAIVVGEGRGSARVVRPPAIRGRTKWSRLACEEWLRTQLTANAPRTLVLIDAGFSYPSGAARLLVGAKSWTELVHAMGERCRTHGTARGVGAHINERFADGAPFRFDAIRSDARWYARNEIAYYRQTELLVPQVISEFYLGSGAAVGFHTITLLATLSALMRDRERGDLAFDVWPQETFAPRAGRHVLAECYPSLCRATAPLRATEANANLNPHEADALVACEWARARDRKGTLASSFELREVPIGRDTRLSWRAQIAEEGWILGVTSGSG